MTLPTTTILPIHSQKIREGGDELESYMRELVFALQSQYEELAQATNGNIKTNADEDRVRWVPVISDSADSSTTFTYDHQIGWVLRKGIFVDLWFDIKWSAVAAGTIAGNMQVNLPYKVAQSEQKPFVGVVQPSGFAFTAGIDCVINARPNSFILDVFNTGNGVTTANQGSVASGQIVGHIRYVGQQIERD